MLGASTSQVIRMATSFEVIYLGNLAVIDPAEGNSFVSQNAVNSWLGTYGSTANPLSNTAVRDFAPGSSGFAGGNATSYDIDNNLSNDTFTIDGVEKTHDATMLFDATLTYKDGTTATISAVLSQDTNGDVYLMPEFANNSDATALGAGPIAAITLNSPIYPGGQAGAGYNLFGDRFATNFVPCFTAGSLIATPRGERPVEDLRPGDRVITRDNGLQKICWVGRRDLSRGDLAALPDLQPILIRAGALSRGMPERDLLVSPNHRMLVASERAEVMFGEREVLVAAKHLTGLDGIDRAPRTAVSYVHLMFSRHEVILADGAWSESFQPGDYSLQGVGEAQRGEILTLFPELATRAGIGAYQAARLSLKAHEAALLVAEAA